MFCRRCGYQIRDGERFCSVCGAPRAENTYGYNSGTGYQYNGGNNYNYRNAGNGNKGDWFSLENIERLGPAVALAPIVMAVVVALMKNVLLPVLRFIPIVGDLIHFLILLTESVFIFVTVGATVGLVYVVLARKNASRLGTWLTPIGTFLAAISCFGIAFDGGAFAAITGLIAVILGVEFMARIVINGQPIDSAFNYGAAIYIYSQSYGVYKERKSSYKASQKFEVMSAQASKFDGSGVEALGYLVLGTIICLVTCGFGAPWMICTITKWRLEHTVINGKRLTFTGTGGSLLGHWILWWFLTIITFGIYGFFLYVSLKKWELKHTYVQGEAIMANGNESYFDGNSFAFLGYSLFSGLLLLVTCGLAYPWVMAMIQRWDTKHRVVNNKRLQFSGSGLGFLGEFLIIGFFSLITCGIYYPWGLVRMNRYIIRHTDFQY